jgi:3-oxoacid CoA-transferase subunit B
LDEKDPRMALTKDQVARRAAKELDPLSETIDGERPLTLVASFAHSDLESVARRSSRSQVVVAGDVHVSEAGDLGMSARLADLQAPVDGEGKEGAAARRVVVVMDHCDKDGSPRIVSQCALAIAGRGLVSRVFTELATIDVSPDGLILREVAPGVSARDVQDHTEPTLKVGPDLKEMRPE